MGNGFIMVFMSTISVIKNIWQSIYRLYGVGHHVKYGDRLHLGIGTHLSAPANLTIGDDVYFGRYCTIECNGKIGNNVLVANQVGLVGRLDHDYRVVGAPIRQAPWIGDNSYLCRDSGEIIIQDDVWIGYGAIVLSGVSIGRGAIIASGAVVTKNVAPYSIVAGVPAQVLGRRFEWDKIQEHEKILYGRVITSADELNFRGLH